MYLKAPPIKSIVLAPAEIKKLETATAALEISSASNAGSFGTNKWGRVGYQRQLRRANWKVDPTANGICLIRPKLSATRRANAEISPANRLAIRPKPGMMAETAPAHREETDG